jgi:hypothetical protein
MRLINPEKGVRWIHPDERDQDTPTIFHIVPLTEGQSRRLLAARQNIRADGGAVQIDIDKFLGDLYLKNVVQIDNVLWPGSTTPVTIATEADRLRFLECVPAGFMGPIYQAIQNLSKLDEGEIKNSGGSSASPIFLADRYCQSGGIVAQTDIHVV